ncbi:PAAR-like domain-containing protein [Mesorhizobium sp. M0091]|uniref:PAAR-like domain-containing protein n=1 Tax=Mesorhizobium sp. M0091 TaxID=2956875 RepID=UPI00333DC917
MTKNVFAGMWEIAAENGMNKSIARFPDVCMSPPSPPAGPIPIPYPDTSFSNNLKSGSSTVKIGGKGAALAQKSYYKESVLGDEAATRTFGANVVTHQITGKTYFQAWCMDVKYEGKNVCRHIDITTSNHASTATTTAPLPTGESMSVADQDALIKQGICPCCKGPVHSQAQASGKRVSAKEWYEHDFSKAKKASGHPFGPAELRDIKAAQESYQVAKELAKETGCEDSMPSDDPNDPCSAHYLGVTAKESQDARDNEWEEQKRVATKLSNRLAAKRYGKKVAKKVVRQGERVRAAIKGAHPDNPIVSIGHKTALAAGGCPVGKGNHGAVYKRCEAVDKLLGDGAQSTLADMHRKL